MGSTTRRNMRSSTAAIRRWSGRAVDFIYEKHQRHGMLRREIERMVNQDRNYFAAAMLALGEADAMITGTTRPFSQSLRQVRMVIDDEPGATPFGINVIVGAPPYRADRRHGGDRAARRRAICGDRHALGGLRAPHGPGAAHRVHFSYTTFGNPPGIHIEELARAP